MQQKKAADPDTRAQWWLPGRGEGGEGSIGVELWELPSLGIRQAQGCDTLIWEYCQYSEITVNGK